MRIEPNHPYLQYSGRIDFENPKEPVLVYAATNIKLRFNGTGINVNLANHKNYAINSMGFILDGVMGRFDLVNNDKPHNYVIARNLPEGEHELLLYKRQDGCHYVTLYGFDLDGTLMEVGPKPTRRIEVFGDSVSCGEVSEAIDYVGQADPENHDGIFSNSYYSYSWIAARKLGAELHDTSQGGMALLDATGWFNYPDFVGAESCYDKIQYNPFLGERKPWDFTKYVPQVVVLALGQNDSNPEDYMAEDYDGEKAQNWRKHYRAFIETLMEKYPKAVFVLTTTILNHNEAWDRAIDEVAQSFTNGKVTHFLYTKNGCGTHGHIRIPEAEVMADELVAHINSLGVDW